MHRILSSAILALLLIVAVYAISPPWQWGKLTVKDDSFTVMLPGKPTFREYDEKTAGGQLHVINASAYPDMSFTEFTVRAITADFDAEPDSRLDDLCDALIKEFGTRSVSRKEISQTTYKGREVTGISASKSLKARAFVSGRKAFLAFAIVTPSSNNIDLVDKFLDSFMINEKH